MEERYLRLLSREYPNRQSVLCEIANLTAMSGLPKGTEYFFSDLHGEHKGFSELMNGASGVIREKIRIKFDGVLTQPRQNQLANLIYDPVKVLGLMHEYGKDTKKWMEETILHLTQLCREIGAKYSRVHVRSKIPQEYEYLMEELLYPGQEEGRLEYCHQIIESVVESGLADTFIPQFCRLVRSLTMDWIHIIGDIFDRGPRPDRIMEDLIAYQDVDIQWGNHDISWMGAACGNEILIANVVRMGISYNNFDCLEDGYGINLRPLSDFASKAYRDDPCERFFPKVLDENVYDQVTQSLSAKMHKAMAIIQLKLIGQMVHRHPEYQMEDRSLLEHIDYEKGMYCCKGICCPLTDTSFPTVDPKDPLRLTAEEAQLMKVLAASFAHSEALHRHVRFLYSKGSMYLCMNGNLLFHGCIPMNEDKSFAKVRVDGEEFSGKALLDRLEKAAREAYFLPQDHREKQKNVDRMWLLWCSSKSPLFGKSRMSAFERYFTDEKSLHEEVYNSYYRLSEDPHVCERILKEFGVDETHGHIINGHVPVRQKDGEKPVKADGKLYVIDGGLSKAYQAKTGIAGYTLIFNSHYLALAQHHDYISHPLSGPYANEMPILQIIEQMERRILVKDTDAGRQLAQRIDELRLLAGAYENGDLAESVCPVPAKTGRSLHMETMEIVR